MADTAVDVEADVTQEGTTNRTVDVDRDTDVKIRWWKAEYDDTVEHRIGREDRELKYAQPETD